MSSTRWGEEQKRGLRWTVDQAIDGIYKNRMNIVSTLRNVMGEDTANRVVARLDQVNKKLRR